jgi:hypothetical protein
MGEPLDTSDWIAVTAVGVSVASMGVSYLWGRYSAKAARDSAMSARRSADEAAAMTKLSLEQRHDDLAPGPAPAEIAATVRGGGVTDSLVGSITVPRGYRVKATAYFRTGGSTELSIGPVLHANQPVMFQVEKWPPGSEKPVTKEIRFRFWPPIEGDDVEPWSCRCGKPTGDTMDGPGHWEWRVPVRRDRTPIRINT